ncbi:MAG: 2Fe-2S iron-sulfur cluster-binding protein [Verrucomicrobiota bacterium]|nr:2Fe-2S iron-sulfur cluster-binding protein [Verrucomicrobiota bacterium]
MKTVNLEPLNDTVIVKTETLLLDTLLARQVNVAMACGGQGMCATCHIFVKEGLESLTPMTQREQETLSFLTGVKSCSRLSCQARVMGDGIVVEIPEGMFLNQISDIETLVGRRAEINILHPRDGRTLIEKGKIITRSRILELAQENQNVLELRSKSHITR